MVFKQVKGMSGRLDRLIFGFGPTGERMEDGLSYYTQKRASSLGYVEQLLSPLLQDLGFPPLSKKICTLSGPDDNELRGDKTRDNKDYRPLSKGFFEWWCDRFNTSFPSSR